MIPGCSPSTPSSHEPSRLVTSPFLYSAVSSPKYQTLPSASCAYQSKVSSCSAPSALTSSRTTVQTTPMIVLVSSVTSVVVTSPADSPDPSITQRLPGVSGKYGLSTVAVKWAGSMTG